MKDDENCIKFLKNPDKSLYELEEFKNGFFEIQDKGSQELANLIKVSVI